MHKESETTLQVPYVTTSHTETRLTRRLGFQLLTYGATAGLVTTALGAFASSGVTGPTKIVLWTLVTGVLAIGAVSLADPAIAVAARRLCLDWLRRMPSSR